jgi:hypothetical protein
MGREDATGILNPLGWEVVSLDRKCRGGGTPGHYGSADRRTFSIRRLEGRRWWLRRARSMEIEAYSVRIDLREERRYRLAQHGSGGSEACLDQN